MINIITHGLNKKDKKFEYTCPKCGCLFEVDYVDIKRVRGRNNYYYMYVPCPEPFCDDNIIIDNVTMCQKS